MKHSRTYTLIGLVIAFAVLAGMLTYPTLKNRQTDIVSSSVPQGFTLDVVYADDGFHPSSASVAVPTTVIFRNESSRQFWPVSAGQSSSTPCGNNEQSGACEAVAPGASWSATFDKGGRTFHYYDKLNPSSTVDITPRFLP